MSAATASSPSCLPHHSTAIDATHGSVRSGGHGHGTATEPSGLPRIGTAEAALPCDPLRAVPSAPHLRATNVAAAAPANATHGCIAMAMTTMPHGTEPSPRRPPCTPMPLLSRNTAECNHDDRPRPPSPSRSTPVRLSTALRSTRPHRESTQPRPRHGPATSTSHRNATASLATKLRRRAEALEPHLTAMPRRRTCSACVEPNYTNRLPDISAHPALL